MDEIGAPHAHRVEHAVEMVVLVLHDGGMGAGHLAGHRIAVGVHPLVAHAPGARHGGAQARDGEAALPADLSLLADEAQHRVDDRGVGDRPVIGVAPHPLRADAENEQAQRHMYLGRGESGAADIVQRLEHVGYQAADFGGGRVRHRVGGLEENRVSHAGDFQYGHGCCDPVE